MMEIWQQKCCQMASPYFCSNFHSKINGDFIFSIIQKEVEKVIVKKIGAKAEFWYVVTTGIVRNFNWEARGQNGKKCEIISVTFFDDNHNGFF